MDRKETDELEEAQISFIKMAKVAVATAIIRSKPENMTGQEYATSFYQRIQSSSNLWKEKCKELELELMKTKNSLLLQTENQSKGTLTDSHRSSAAKIPSCLSATPPSSSETLQNYKAMAQVPVQCDHIIESHAEFLASVSRLKLTKKYFDRISDHEYEYENVNELVTKARMIEEQIPQSVTKIFSVIRSINRNKRITLTQVTLFHSLDSIMRVFSSVEEYVLTSDNEDNGNLITIASNIVEDIHNFAVELQTEIMKSEAINEHEIQELRCKLLIFLSNFARFRATILKQLVAGICDVGSQLKMSVKNGKDSIVPVHLHENAGYLFNTLESILCRSYENSGRQFTGETDKQGENEETDVYFIPQPLIQENINEQKYNSQIIFPASCDTMPTEKKETNFKRILSNNEFENDSNFIPEILFHLKLLLEDTVLTTSERFPLFSFHVWRIYDLMKKFE